ncbi:hypothetical protein LguiA_014045 [Lonicera macranthoides]
MANTSKILIIGATGFLGKFLVEASSRSGHPTFALIRDSKVSDPHKSKITEEFKNSGVKLIHGDIYHHESLVNAIKQVDVVISAVGGSQLADQVKIIDAIKEAGNVKRFLPSEFSVDEDLVHPVEPAATLFKIKSQIRRAIEAEEIPHTYVACNGFASYFVPSLGQLNCTTPPRDKVAILGEGNKKATFVKEEDIATYTIKAVDDPRTLNKVMYMRPHANTLSFNELVSLWEKKIGKTLERTYLLEDQILKNIKEAPMDLSIYLSILHSIFVKGTDIEMEATCGVEASELYPEVKYTSTDEYLNQFL